MFAVLDRSRHGGDVLSCVEGSDKGPVFEALNLSKKNTFHPTVYFCHSLTAAVATFRIKFH